MAVFRWCTLAATVLTGIVAAAACILFFIVQAQCAQPDDAQFSAVGLFLWRVAPWIVVSLLQAVSIRSREVFSDIGRLLSLFTSYISADNVGSIIHQSMAALSRATESCNINGAYWDLQREINAESGFVELVILIFLVIASAIIGAGKRMDASARKRQKP